MTQREMLPQDDHDGRVVYNTPPRVVHSEAAMPDVHSTQHIPTAQVYEQPVSAHNVVHTNETPDSVVENRVEAPIDRVRWGAILAGLFAALSTLALLSLFGLAIGASAFDANDRVQSYGLGAGIWGGVSALLAFLIGGWVAAKTAAVHGERNGLLNGAMVWAVAVPLLLYLLTSGVGSLVGTAANVGAQAAGVAAATAAGQGIDPATTAQQSVEGLQTQVTAQDTEQIANTTARTAWGTLGSLLMGLGAAAMGGYLGAHVPARTTVRRRAMPGQ